MGYYKIIFKSLIQSHFLLKFLLQLSTMTEVLQRFYRGLGPEEREPRVKYSTPQIQGAVMELGPVDNV